MPSTYQSLSRVFFFKVDTTFKKIIEKGWRSQVGDILSRLITLYCCFHVIYWFYCIWKSTSDFQLEKFLNCLNQGLVNIFCEGPDKYLRLCRPYGLWQLFTSVIVAQKQPKTVCKQMDMALFQENFIYQNR